jgi:hypothetical protein
VHQSISQNALSDDCGIEDDGFMALVSALEQNTISVKFSLAENQFAIEASWRWQRVFPVQGIATKSPSHECGFSIEAAVVAGRFLKEHQLGSVNIEIDRCENMEWSQNWFLGEPGFTFKKASDPSMPPVNSVSVPSTGCGDRFASSSHLRNKPKLGPQ